MSETKRFDVPPQGSLSLLAYGSKGLKAWRKARKEAEQEKEQHEK